MGCRISKCTRCADVDSAATNPTRESDEDVLPAVSASADGSDYRQQFAATDRNLAEEQRAGTFEKPDTVNVEPQSGSHQGVNVGGSAVNGLRPNSSCRSDDLDSEAPDDSEDSFSSESLPSDDDTSDASVNSQPLGVTYGSACGSNKSLAFSDVNSWDDGIENLTLVKSESETSVDKLVSTSFASELEQLEEEILKCFDESVDSKQLKCKMTSEPLSNGECMLETAGEPKDKEISAKPKDEIALIEQLKTERQNVVRNDHQAAIKADTGNLHERSETKRADGTRQNVQAAYGYVEVGIGGKRTDRLQRVSTRYEGMRDDSELNIPTVVGEQQDDRGQMKIGIRRTRGVGSSVVFGQKCSLTPTAEQEQLEEEILRDLNESVKNETHNCKLTSVPLINPERTLETGGDREERDIRATPMDEIALALENERQPFAGNDHQAAPAANMGTLHDRSTTNVTDRTAQGLQAADGYVEVKSGVRWTGRVLRLLTRRGSRKSTDPTAGEVRGGSQRNSTVSEVPGGDKKQVHGHHQTDISKRSGKHKVDNVVAFRKISPLVSRMSPQMVVPFDLRQRPHDPLSVRRRHSDGPVVRRAWGSTQPGNECENDDLAGRKEQSMDRKNRPRGSRGPRVVKKSSSITLPSSFYKHSGK